METANEPNGRRERKRVLFQNRQHGDDGTAEKQDKMNT